MYAAYFWTRHGLRRSAAIFKDEAEARKYAGFHCMAKEYDRMRKIYNDNVYGRMPDDNVFKIRRVS